eukprot:g1477.t1
MAEKNTETSHQRHFCAVLDEDVKLPDDAERERVGRGELQSVNDRIQRLREDIIGRMNVFDTPFGKRPIMYADWTASGRSVGSIENYIRESVLPLYGNTHTSTSITGLQTTCFRHEARQIISQAVNGHRKDDVVLMTGSGSTAAVNRMVHILGFDRPLAKGAPQPIVFVGPHEHHSNLLPWRESCAKVITINENAEGRMDASHLKRELEAHKGRFMVGSFSACSNVTGVLADVLGVTALLHRHGALSFWDYATAAPYVNIDMNPVVMDENAPFVYKDAVFVSPHKFVGGPGAAGVLVAKKRLFTNKVPNHPGGGTVFYVSEEAHRFVSNRIEREEGGTPDIIGSVRAGLAFQLKRQIGDPEILQRIEAQMSRRAIDALANEKNVHVLASRVEGPRLPVVSFVIRHEKSGRILHHNFVSALLNDLYGIQARGGCACAGPYAQRLLGMSAEEIRRIENELLEKHELLRPGFSRVSFPYFMSDGEMAYVLDAIGQVAQHGWRMLPQYRFNHKTGEWLHRTRFTKFPNRVWLSNASLLDSRSTAAKQKREGEKISNTSALLAEALKIYESAGHDMSQDAFVSDQSQVLGTDAAESLRWFVYPSEVYADIRAITKSSSVHVDNEVVDAHDVREAIPIRPQAYMRNKTLTAKKDSGRVVPRSGAESLGSVIAHDLERKYPRRTAAETPSEFSGVTLSPRHRKRPAAVRESVPKRMRTSKDAPPQKRCAVSKASGPKTTTMTKPWRAPSIPKKIMRAVGQAIGQWGMIREGDRLLLGLSGGKDSLTLLNVLIALQRRSPVRFELAAATVDPKTDAFKPKPLRAYVESLGVPYFFLEEPIFDRAKSGLLQGNSICSFCARMKRGLLYSCCRREGYNVLVLGQHLDDLVESFIMSAFNNGSLRTMKANYTIDEGDLRVIRPLVYVREIEMRKYSLAARLPVINENCPACFEAPKERHRVKKLLQQEESACPGLFSRLRRAIMPLMEDGTCNQMRALSEKRLQSGKDYAKRKHKRGSKCETKEKSVASGVKRGNRDSRTSGDDTKN